MSSLLIVLIVATLLYGGLGYRYRDRLGAYYASGTSLLGLLVAIFLVLVFVGAIHL